MGHKSRKQKKDHGCGHGKTFGKFCHLCKQIADGILVKTRQGKYLPSKLVNPADIA